MTPESSDRLANAIEAHTQEMRVVRDVLDEIRSELQYAVQNNKVLYVIVEDLLARGDEQQGVTDDTRKHLPITRMSKDPTRRDFRVTFGRDETKPDLNSRPTVVCDGCNREVSPEDATREKWKDVARWKGGGTGAFLGICPGCQEPAELPTPQPNAKPSVERRGTLF